MDDNGRVQPGPDIDVAERLRRRYPRSRLPRIVVVAVVTVCAAAGLAWLVWAALVFSRPAVAAQVSAFRVVSDSVIEVTVTVDRRDPARPVACRLVAQARDFQPVAEQRLEIGPARERLVDTRVRLTTLRRATSATVKDCAVR